MKLLTGSQIPLAALCGQWVAGYPWAQEGGGGGGGGGSSQSPPSKPHGSLLHS